MGNNLRLFKSKKNNNPEPIVELVVDAPVYGQLKKRALMEGISENAELLHALRQGMTDYWLHVAKYERERYQQVEKLFEQSKKDNELLDAIINQNESFYEILKDKTKKV